jgi:glycoside/pentoside/hexuronide:cation symporter, GPH family
MKHPKPVSTPAGWHYGALGFSLAFVALPLYVILPNHYATQYGLELRALGFLLLGARLLDAVVDPWLGRCVDRWFGHSSERAWQVAAGAGVVLALGFYGLFSPPSGLDEKALWVWCATWLVITYFSYSVISVIHQVWGARLGGHAVAQARTVAWREGLALVGVLVASVLPSLIGLAATALVLTMALGLGLALLKRAQQPQLQPSALSAPLNTFAPFQTCEFRRLLAVYLVNGIASAVPATLVIFFITDRLQAPSYQPLFLGSYFAAGALSVPLWLGLVKRLGLARTWLVGMGLAIAVFAFAALLGSGDVMAFWVVCVLSGVALGADLTLPSAMLTGVIQRAGHSGGSEGAYLGWWHFATKLNLALAAGLALPLLQLFGYAPGKQGPVELAALSAAYCLLPCALKLMAAVLLFRQGTQP